MKPLPYAWRDLRFTVDADLVDQTAVVLTRLGLPGTPAGEASYTLCVSEDAAPAGVAAYVDEALREMATSLPGFRLGAREHPQVLGKKAVVVDGWSLSPDGDGLVQRQAFIDRGNGRVVVVTASAREGGAEADMRGAVSGVIASLTLTGSSS